MDNADLETKFIVKPNLINDNINKINDEEMIVKQEVMFSIKEKNRKLKKYLDIINNSNTERVQKTLLQIKSKLTSNLENPKGKEDSAFNKQATESRDISTLKKQYLIINQGELRKLLPNMALEKTAPFINHIGISPLNQVLNSPIEASGEKTYLLQTKKFKFNLVNTLLHQVDFEEKVNFTFNLYDTNQNGYIEFEEFEALLKHFNDNNSLNFDLNTLKSIVKVLFEEIDTDNTGKLTKDAFRTFLEKYKDKPLTLNPFSREKNFSSAFVYEKKKTEESKQDKQRKLAMQRTNADKSELNNEIQVDEAIEFPAEINTIYHNNGENEIEEDEGFVFQKTKKLNEVNLNFNESITSSFYENYLGETDSKNSVESKEAVNKNKDKDKGKDKMSFGFQKSNSIINKNLLKKGCCTNLTFFLSKYFVFVLYLLLNVGTMVFYFFRFYKSKGLAVIGCARAFAGLNMLNSSILLFYMCENVITFIISSKYLIWLQYLIPLNNHKKYHKMSAIFFCIGGLGHALVHLSGTFPTLSHLDLAELNKILNVKLDFVPSYFFLLLRTIPGITGICLTLLLLILMFFSLRKYRNNNFELFFYLHKIYFLIFPLIHIHGTQRLVVSQEYMFFIAFPALLFLIFEIALRLYRYCAFKVKVKSLKFLECRVVELVLERPKNFSFSLCQYARVNFPLISKLQWHPFTIASSPQNKSELVFYISPVGFWTKQLEKIARKLSPEVVEKYDCHAEERNALRVKGSLGNKNKSEENLNFDFDKIDAADSFYDTQYCRIDGPFGAPTQNFKNYRHLILIAGGIGATPFASILFDILHNIEKNNNYNENESFNNPLIKNNTSSGNSNHQIENDFYANCIIEFYWVIKGYVSCSWLVHLFQQIMSKDINKKIKFNLIFTCSQQKYDFRSFFLWHGLEILKRKRPHEISDYCANIFWGRPDWDTMFMSRRLSIIRNNEDKSLKGYNVGVFICGNYNICYDVSDSCKKFSDGKIKFDFHKENF